MNGPKHQMAKKAKVKSKNRFMYKYSMFELLLSIL